MDHPPLDALAAAEQLCGPLELTEITNRRGSAVWKAAGPDATVAIKAGTTDQGRTITDREAVVTSRLTPLAPPSGDGWFISPWHRGPSTWHAFADARNGIGRLEAHRAALGLSLAVASLHQAGWVHSDLQPSHSIHTDTGVRLLDYAWAWHRDHPQSPIFRGGIVHLLAPELAAFVEANDGPVQPTPGQEVYTLAALLWTCTTGHWPLDYDAIGLDPNSTPADRRTAIATKNIPLTQTRTWPELQHLLRGVLLCSPTDRPTAVELAMTLEWL